MTTTSTTRALCCAVLFAGCFGGSGDDEGAGTGGAAGSVLDGNGGTGAGTSGATGGTNAIGGTNAVGGVGGAGGAGGAGGDGGTGTGGSGGGPACLDSHTTRCGAVCTDMTSDAQNCGACGNACTGSTPVCKEGHCGPLCDVYWMIWCDGKCVDPSTASNCGGCDNICSGATPVCQAGKCVASCYSYEIACDGGCGTGTPWNCGACGNVCGGATPDCRAGECAPCGATETNCGGRCVSTTSDRFHCGGCDNVCGDDAPYCIATSVPTSPGAEGRCSPCPAPLQEMCDGFCVDTSQDPEHCGACGTRCGDDTPSCCSGKCASACTHS